MCVCVGGGGEGTGEGRMCVQEEAKVVSTVLPNMV